MRAKRAFIAVLLMLGAVAGRCQSSATHDATAVPNAEAMAGVWRAEADGLPAVTLVVSDEGGNLTGAILFYFLKRETPDKPFTATAGIPEPMFNLKFDGKALTFQVSHRRAHPPRTLSDPPVTMRLKLTGANAAGQMQAEVTNLSERPPALNERLPAAIAVKSDY